MFLKVLMLKQDDPRKCSAAKLVKFGLAKPVTRTASRTLILNPFSKKILLKSDKKFVNSITGIDCSWNLITSAFKKSIYRHIKKASTIISRKPNELF